jgi:hypothetical protein
MTEWREISLAPDYEVSDEGKIRRRVFVRGKPPVILKPWMNSVGYPVVRLHVGGCPVRTLVSRITCTAFHGEPRGTMREVDHIDRNPSNNHQSNLRWTNRTGNNANQSARHGSSAFKGVVAITNRRFKAYGSLNGRTVYLGSFKEERSAADAYDRHAQRTYGQFAQTNDTETQGD